MTTRSSNDIQQKTEALSRRGLLKSLAAMSAAGWMAGGGIRGGQTYGQTDDFSYNIVENPMHVHDFHATLLHLLGIDHERLTFRYQGRAFRLTDVHGHVADSILA